MAYWTIIGVGSDSDGPPTSGKSFGITIDTKSMDWILTGQHSGLFFKSRAGNGKFATFGASGEGLQLTVIERGTQRKKPVAFFKALTSKSVPHKSKGTGQAHETVTDFEWTLM